jgi:hypothetical protein
MQATEKLLQSGLSSHTGERAFSAPLTGVRKHALLQEESKLLKITDF